MQAWEDINTWLDAVRENAYKANCTLLVTVFFDALWPRRRATAYFWRTTFPQCQSDNSYSVAAQLQEVRRKTPGKGSNTVKK